MNPSQGTRVALCAAFVVALAGCVENSYNSKQQRGMVVNEEAAAPSTASSTSSSSSSAAKKAPTGSSGPSGDAPALAHQGPAEAEGYTLAGFKVYEDDGRLWVFKAGSDNLKSYLEKGEPAKRVTLVGEGPDGITLMGSDTEVMKSYADAARFSAPILVAGGAAGRLRGNRHVTYPKHTPLANLHLSLLNKVGVPMDSFADSTGTIDELFEPLTL